MKQSKAPQVSMAAKKHQKQDRSLVNLAVKKKSSGNLRQKDESVPKKLSKTKAPLLDTGGSSNFYLDESTAPAKSAERSPEAVKQVGTPNIRTKDKINRVVKNPLASASSMVLLPKKRIKAQSKQSMKLSKGPQSATQPNVQLAYNTSQVSGMNQAAMKRKTFSRERVGRQKGQRRQNSAEQSENKREQEHRSESIKGRKISPSIIQTDTEVKVVVNQNALDAVNRNIMLLKTNNQDRQFPQRQKTPQPPQAIVPQQLPYYGDGLQLASERTAFRGKQPVQGGMDQSYKNTMDSHLTTYSQYQHQKHQKTKDLLDELKRQYSAPLNENSIIQTIGGSYSTQQKINQSNVSKVSSQGSCPARKHLKTAKQKFIKKKAPLQRKQQSVENLKRHYNEKKLSMNQRHLEDAQILLGHDYSKKRTRLVSGGTGEIEFSDGVQGSVRSCEDQVTASERGEERIRQVQKSQQKKGGEQTFLLTFNQKKAQIQQSNKKYVLRDSSDENKKTVQFEEIKRILSTDLEPKKFQDMRRQLNTKSQSHSPNNVNIAMDRHISSAELYQKRAVKATRGCQQSVLTARHSLLQVDEHERSSGKQRRVSISDASYSPAISSRSRIDSLIQNNIRKQNKKKRDQLNELEKAKKDASKRKRRLEKKNAEIRYSNMPRQFQTRLATMDDQENYQLNVARKRQGTSPQQPHKDMHLIEVKQKHTPTEMPFKLTSDKSVGKRIDKVSKRVGLRQSFTQRAHSPDYLTSINANIQQNFDLNQISYKDKYKQKLKYDLGLDFRQLKKELVDELKSYTKPKKVLQKVQQQFVGLRQSNGNWGGPGSAPPGGVQQPAQQIARHNSVSQQKLPTYSSRKNLANPEVISGLMSARVMATPTQCKKKQSLKTSDSRKILIELQMRQRLQEQRQNQQSQLNEQQRVLNNLKNLNLNVQNRVFKSIKTQREHLSNLKFNEQRIEMKTRNRNQVQLHSGQETERLTLRGGAADFVPAIQLKKQFESRDKRKLKRQQFINEPKSVNAKSRKNLKKAGSPIAGVALKQSNLINRRFRKKKLEDMPSDEFPSRSIVLNIPKAGSLMQHQSREGHDIVQQNQFKCLSQREFSAACNQESMSSNEEQMTTQKRRANSALLGSRSSSKRGQTESSPRRKTLSTHRTINKTITQSPQSRKKFQVRKTISRSSQSSTISMRSPQPLKKKSPKKGSLPELDQEDLVIYIILTQAATMIQRAFRAYLERKDTTYYVGSGRGNKSNSDTDEMEDFHKPLPLKVLEAQQLMIEESASSRRQLQSYRSQLAEIVTPSLKRSSDSDNDFSSVTPQSLKNEPECKSDTHSESVKQRKHTFSFGVHKQSQDSNVNQYQQYQNLEMEPQITSSAPPQNEYHHHYSNHLEKRATPQLGLPQEPEHTAQFHHHPQHSSDVDPSEIMLVIQMEDGSDCDSEKQTPKADKWVNNQSQNDTNEGIQSYENLTQRKAMRQNESAPSSGEGEVRKQITKILIEEKKEYVSEQIGQTHLVVAQAGSGSASGSGTVVSNREQSSMYINNLNTSNDSNKNHQSASRHKHNQHPYGGDTSSLLASLAERTDKIINYSGYVNTTTEDLIDTVECEESATGTIATATIEKPFDKVVKSEKVEPDIKTHNTIEEEGPSEENESAYNGENASPKQLMRMVSGDEQFNKAQLTKSEPRIASPLVAPPTEHDSYLAYNNPNTVSTSLANAANVTGSSHHLLQLTGAQSQNSISEHNRSDLYSQSHFLQTNASIFERNPFQEYTQSKLKELLDNQTSKTDIKSMRDDALRYGKQIQLAYIERQANKDSLSPRSVQRRRYELEEWVTSGRNPTSDSEVSEKSSKGFNLDVERNLTEQIITEVNAKVNQIKIELQKKKEDQKVTSSEPSPPITVPACSPQDPDQSIEKSLEVNETASPARSAKSAKSGEALTLHPRIQEKGEAMKALSKIEGEEILDNQSSDASVNADQVMTGVDTSIDAIEQYIEGILSQIRARAEQFLHAFYTPIYKDPVKVMQNLQKSEKEKQQPPPESDQEDEEDLSNTLSSILNVELYLTLERARENMIRDALAQIREQAGSQQEFDSELSGILSEADHIHNKSVFDAINEALNLVRPYGSKGEPMPWSSAPRRSFFVYADEEHLEKILKGVKINVYAWATTRAGQISTATVVVSPEATKKKEDGEEGEGEKGFVQNQLVKQTQHTVSEETLLLNREKVLSRLVAKEIANEEPKWTDFEQEETQCKLDVADLIFEQLCGEAVNILNEIKGDKEKV